MIPLHETHTFIPCSPEPDLFVRTPRMTIVVQAYRVEKEQAPVTVQCLHLRGELDTESVPALEELFDRLVQRGNLRVGLDLSHLSHVHSSGLFSLFRQATRLDELGGALRILRPSQDVRELLEFLGLTHCLPIDDDTKRHLRAFISPPDPVKP